MTGIDNITYLIQWRQSINKSLTLRTQISEMIKAREKVINSYSGVNMITEIAKSMQHQKILVSPTLSVIDAITKSISFQPKFVIPQTTLDTIKSINHHHEQLLSGIRAMTEALKIRSSVLAQINSLHFALSGISGQVAAIAARQRNWTIIEDFEEVTEQAIEFSENLTEEVTEEQKRQFQILLTLVIAFVKKYGAQGFLTIDIILRFAGIHQYYDFLKEKPEVPTKKEFNQLSIKQDSIIHFIGIVNEQLRQAKEYRITNRECLVRLKPKLRTLTLSRLPKDFEIVVIQLHHKWAYVSYFDPNDNLPQTGWIMKKYLDKPE